MLYIQNIVELFDGLNELLPSGSFAVAKYGITAYSLMSVFLLSIDLCWSIVMALVYSAVNVKLLLCGDMCTFKLFCLTFIEERLDNGNTIKGASY